MADRPRQLSTPVKLPKLRANVIRPRGPESIHIKEQFIGGYGDPPPGFIGGQNSITESSLNMLPGLSRNDHMNRKAMDAIFFSKRSVTVAPDSWHVFSANSANLIRSQFCSRRILPTAMTKFWHWLDPWRVWPVILPALSVTICNIFDMGQASKMKWIHAMSNIARMGNFIGMLREKSMGQKKRDSICPHGPRAECLHCPLVSNDSIPFGVSSCRPRPTRFRTSRLVHATPKFLDKLRIESHLTSPLSLSSISEVGG